MFATKNIKAKFIAYDFSGRYIWRGTFVLYRDQSPVNCILLNCILVDLSDTNILWLKNIFSNVIKQVGFLQKRNPIRGVQYFPIPIAMNIK